MSRVVFLSCILWASVGLGGQLIPSLPLEEPQRVLSQAAYDDNTVFMMYGPGAGDGTTIAYIDLYGTASRLDLLSQKLDESGKVMDAYELVASAQPEDLGEGYTRFSFRGMGLRPELRQGPRGWYSGFGNGVGVHLGFRGARFPLMENHQNDIPFTINSLLLDGQTLVSSGIPEGWALVNFTSETLDPPFGDVNQDGRIDINDFGTLKVGFGTSGDPYQNGDVTGNRVVNLVDFGILSQNFGWRQSAVPEPSAFGLLGLGIVLFALRKIVPRVMVR